MEILVRKYISNGDKSNKKVTTIEEALKVLGRDLNTVYLKVDFLNCVDLFFTGTDNYLRIIN
jgi:hypothetical protein